MKQSRHLNSSEETGTGCPITSKYGRTLPNKDGGVGRQQQFYNQQHNVIKQVEKDILLYKATGMQKLEKMLPRYRFEFAALVVTT